MLFRDLAETIGSEGALDCQGDSDEGVDFKNEEASSVASDHGVLGEEFLNYSAPPKLCRRYPLIQYAVANWVYHTNQCGERIIGELVAMLLTRMQHNTGLAKLVLLQLPRYHSLDLKPKYTSPLMVAAYCGFVKACLVLLNSDINATKDRSQDACTPLIYAILG